MLASQKQHELCNKYKNNVINIILNSSISSINFENSEKKYLITEGYEQFMDQIENLEICKKCPKTTKKILYNQMIKIVLSIIDKIIIN